MRKLMISCLYLLLAALIGACAGENTPGTHGQDTNANRKTQEQTYAGAPSPSVPSASNVASAPRALELHTPDGTSLSIDIHDLPIYEEYLSEQQSPWTEWNRSTLVNLDLGIPSTGTFALLQYNCGNKACSTLLISISSDGVRTLPMPDGIFQDTRLSPNQEQLLLRYADHEGGLVTRHRMFAVDLKRWEFLSPVLTKDAEELMEEATWPIRSYEWVNNEQFKAEIASLSSPSYEAVQSWFEGEQHVTRDVTVRIEQRRSDEDES